MKYQGKITDPKDLVTKEYVDTGLSGKQNTLTFDDVPTAGSANPVKSSGIKSALNTVDESIAIRVSGNKTTYASGAAIGQYVIVDGSTITGITDGLYKAAKAIPYNTAIDSTYLTAVSGGGMNELKAALDKLVPISIPISLTSADTSKTIDVSSYIPSGKSLRGVVAPTLGAYPLPYISGGTIQTWVAETQANGLILISNSVQWGTYTFRGFLNLA